MGAKKLQINIADILVAMFILYFSGVFQFLGSKLLLSALNYFFLFISIISFIYYPLKYKKLSALDTTLYIFACIYPIICAIQSYKIFNQPFLMGIASMRYGLFVFWGYFLYLIKYPYQRIIRQINALNIIVAIASIILFTFGFDDVSIQRYIVNTNFYELESQEDMIKGSKLTSCSTLMIISYVYYTVLVIRKTKFNKSFIYFCILISYLIFVHKGRIPLATIALLIFAYYIKLILSTIVFTKDSRIFIQKKNLTKIGGVTLIGIVALSVLLLSNPSTLSSFSSIIDFSDSEDTSTLARIESASSVLPYIEQHYILGFGNLSSHYLDGGFHNYFGKYFYLADIGILGAFAQGGIFIIILYTLIYLSLFSRSKSYSNDHCRIFNQFIIVALGSSLFLMADYLYSSNCVIFALLFYPLLGTSKPDLFLHNGNSKNIHC